MQTRRMPSSCHKAVPLLCNLPNLQRHLNPSFNPLISISKSIIGILWYLSFLPILHPVSSNGFQGCIDENDRCSSSVYRFFFLTLASRKTPMGHLGRYDADWWRQTNRYLHKHIQWSTAKAHPLISMSAYKALNLLSQKKCCCYFYIGNKVASL